MFIGVETDERGKALDEVAFKSIGTLACAVLREAELRSRAPSTAANWNEAGSGEATASMQPTTGGMSELGKEAGAETPASSDREELRQTARRSGAADTYRTHARPALRLVMGGRGRAIATANTKGRPQPSAVARPLLLVVGGSHYTASGMG